LCQGCGRPHGMTVRCLPDGRWFDATRQTSRNGRGRPARWPDLVETMQIRQTRVDPLKAILAKLQRPDASRSQLRRTYVTESHTAPLTGAAAKFEQGGFTSGRRGARRPSTAAIVVPYQNGYASSLLLPPFLIVGSCCAKTAGASVAAAGTAAAVAARHGAEPWWRRVETVISTELWMARCKTPKRVGCLPMFSSVRPICLKMRHDR
jgi:hypothetical protein